MLSVMLDACKRGPGKGIRRFLVLAAVALGSAAVAPVQAAEPVLDLSTHRGRVVIVDFWASWCKPCRQSIPWLNTMRARYAAAGLDIIGVNVDAQRADAERFLREVPIDFETVFDPNGALARQFKVQGMPSSFVFGRDGALIETHMGFRDAGKDQKEAALRELLQRTIQ